MRLLEGTSALLVAALVLGAAACSKTSSDATITSRVKSAISNEPALKGAKVSVSTNEKVVHLSGTVKSRDERALLIAAARKVEGVKAVKTDLVVTPPQKMAQAKAKPRPTQKRATRPPEQFEGTGR